MKENKSKWVFSPIRIIKEDVIGSENTLFGWSLLAAVCIILAMGFYLSMPDLSFHGLASAREVVVNFEFPVEISQLHVVQGQQVKKGELLIELNQTALNTRIRELSSQVEKLKAELAIRDQMSRTVGNTHVDLSADPLSVELRDHLEELEVLRRQRNSLYVFAEADGVVGSVNFMKGQRVAAFAAVLTLSAMSPTYVEGYVPERLRTSLHIGSLVEVSSMTGGASSIVGKVVGVGARYVAIPPRLVPEARGLELWGREVTVEIPENSQLLLAERVLITPKFSLFPRFVEPAASATGSQVIADDEPRAIVLPQSLIGKTKMEASGVVFLPDLKKYLIVSDDTDEGGKPWLFLMDSQGQIDEQYLTIPGIDVLKDLESLSSSGGFIYAMTSLKQSDKGKVKAKANALVRSSRNGLNLSSTQSVNLGSILREALSQSKEPKIVEIVAKLDLFEVEAHAIREGALYVALKEPRSATGDSIILKVASVEQLFSSDASTVKVEYWRGITIPQEFSEVQRISDMVFVGDRLVFSTGCKGHHCGALWTIAGGETRPTLVRKFSSQAPEGLAVDQASSQMMITFDLDNQGSEFLRIPIRALSP